MDKHELEAVKLIRHYSHVVYPYVGSGYLTGTEDENIKFKLSKEEAIYLTNSMLSVQFPYDNSISSGAGYTHMIYWGNVLLKLNEMTKDSYEKFLKEDPFITTFQ